MNSSSPNGARESQAKEAIKKWDSLQDEYQAVSGMLSENKAACQKILTAVKKLSSSHDEVQKKYSELQNRLQGYAAPLLNRFINLFSSPPIPTDSILPLCKLATDLLDINLLLNNKISGHEVTSFKLHLSSVKDLLKSFSDQSVEQSIVTCFEQGNLGKETVTDYSKYKRRIPEEYNFLDEQIVALNGYSEQLSRQMAEYKAADGPHAKQTECLAKLKSMVENFPPIENYTLENARVISREIDNFFDRMAQPEEIKEDRNSSPQITVALNSLEAQGALRSLQLEQTIQTLENENELLKGQLQRSQNAAALAEEKIRGLEVNHAQALSDLQARMQELVLAVERAKEETHQLRTASNAETDALNLNKLALQLKIEEMERTAEAKTQEYQGAVQRIADLEVIVENSQSAARAMAETQVRQLQEQHAAELAGLREQMNQMHSDRVVEVKHTQHDSRQLAAVQGDQAAIGVRPMQQHEPLQGNAQDNTHLQQEIKALNEQVANLQRENASLKASQSQDGGGSISLLPELKVNSSADNKMLSEKTDIQTHLADMELLKSFIETHAFDLGGDKVGGKNIQFSDSNDVLHTKRVPTGIKIIYDYLVQFNKPALYNVEDSKQAKEAYEKITSLIQREAGKRTDKPTGFFSYFNKRTEDTKAIYKKLQSFGSGEFDRAYFSESQHSRIGMVPESRAKF